MAGLRQFRQRMHGSPHRLRGQLDNRPSSPDINDSPRSPRPSAPSSPASPRGEHLQSSLCEASPAGRCSSSSAAHSPLVVSPVVQDTHAASNVPPSRLRSLTYPQSVQRPSSPSPPPAPLVCFDLGLA